MRTAFRLFAVTVGLLLWVHAPASAQTPPTTFDTTFPAVTGSTFPVNAGGSIQTAINAAAAANPNLNHEIVVQAGSAFTGALTIPTRAAGTGWIIIIRSSALASLPAAGTRVGPVNAPNMPKIQGPGTGASFTPIIDIVPGARQWRLVGLEVTVSNGSPHATLIRIGNGGETTVGQLATNIVLDRVYLHSFSTVLSAGLKFGVQMNGAKIALLDSYVDDMKAAPNQILSGDDGESKGVIAWNGSGPFKLVNNFIQAAAINVLFGGSDANAAALRPADLDFRNNYVPKNAARWRGTSVVTKTTFELKNMARVLIEGNRFETAWVPANGDGGQLIRLNVRNQNGSDPGSRVHDITFRNNIVKSGGTGIQFLVHDDPNASANMARGHAQPDDRRKPLELPRRQLLPGHGCGCGVRELRRGRLPSRGHVDLSQPRDGWDRHRREHRYAERLASLHDLGRLQPGGGAGSSRRVDAVLQLAKIARR